MVFKSLYDWLYVVFCGMCMGAADIVPGISGGTVAFIMGFYQKLLNSIKNITFRDFFHSNDNKFLIALLFGVSIAFVTLASHFDYILGHETYRIYLYSAFLGLILASVIFCARQISNWKRSYFFALLAGGVIAFFLTGPFTQKLLNQHPLYDVHLPIQTDKIVDNYNPASQMITDVAAPTLNAMLARGVVSPITIVYSHQHDKMGPIHQLVDFDGEEGLFNLWIACCGMVAICAMLLPGISGSYLLTILGVYPTVIGALADFIAAAKSLVFDAEAFAILANMLLGIVIGAISFSRLISWLLKEHRDLTIALLTGFMLGAMRSVWPFWSYSYVFNALKPAKGPLLHVAKPLLPDFVGGEFYVSVFFALVGFAMVFLVEYLASSRAGADGEVEEA